MSGDMMAQGRTTGAQATERAALAGLMVLKTAMLAALLGGVQPHPPGFLAPLIGAGLALGAMA